MVVPEYQENRENTPREKWDKIDKLNDWFDKEHAAIQSRYKEKLGISDVQELVSEMNKLREKYYEERKKIDEYYNQNTSEQDKEFESDIDDARN